MSQLDPEAIAQKLNRMVERIEKLKKFEQLTIDAYLQDDVKQAAIERFLEKMIDSALNINKTLLKRAAGLIPTERSQSFQNFESFILMGENGFTPSELAEQLAPSGSFRNVLAHEYDNVDPTQVYYAFQKAVRQYPLYIRAVQSYLDTLEEN